MFVLGTMTGESLPDMGDISAIPPASSSPYPNANVVFGISPGNHPPGQVRPSKTPLVNMPMPGTTPPNWRASVPSPAYSSLNHLHSNWSRPDTAQASQVVSQYEAPNLTLGNTTAPASIADLFTTDNIKQHLPWILGGAALMLLF